MMKKMDFKSVVLFLAPTVLVTASEPGYTQTMAYGVEKIAALSQPHSRLTSVQAGAFRSLKNASQLKARIEKQFHYPVRIVHDNGYYRVVVNRTGSPVKTSAAPVRHTVQSLPAPYPKTTGSQPARLKDEPLEASTGNWIVGAGAALSWSSLSNHVTVANGSAYAPPNNVDYYSTSMKNQPRLDLLAGYRWQRDQQWLAATELAVRYQHMFSRSINGNITQYAIPEFNNYTYSWDVSRDVLSLYSKMDLTRYRQVMPYIDASIGVAFNRAGQYSETSITPPVTSRINPAFGSRTESAFTYSVGAGLDFQFTPKFIMSLGYDYQSFGQFASGPGQSTWSSSRLKLNHSAANSALLGLTFLL
ncbi:SPOR domain-containing protein [Legionella sp. CNM-4043-24]|uniref:SPOR domain-containing protein n=1 Tax=Legionella sp. CNM-4043-24 TaxID=3421646 RepID=UPI00403AC3B9